MKDDQHKKEGLMSAEAGQEHRFRQHQDSVEGAVETFELSSESLDRIWDNEWDAVYDDLDDQ